MWLSKFLQLDYTMQLITIYGNKVRGGKYLHLPWLYGLLNWLLRNVNTSKALLIAHSCCKSWPAGLINGFKCSCLLIPLTHLLKRHSIMRVYHTYCYCFCVFLSYNQFCYSQDLVINESYQMFCDGWILIYLAIYPIMLIVIKGTLFIKLETFNWGVEKFGI